MTRWKGWHFPTMVTDLGTVNGSRENIKMPSDTVTTLRMLAAKLTLIFGKRVTYQETIEILCGHIDDESLDRMAREYARTHHITLPRQPL